MADLVAKGWNGIITLNGDRLRIEKFRPKLYSIDNGGAGETIFRLNDSAVQRFKEATTSSIRMWGMGRAGFYSIATAHASLTGTQTINAEFARTPSVVVFESDANHEFRALRDGVEATIERLRVPAATLADQLGALTDLRERGVLSEDEFAHAKSRFLGAAPDSAERAAQIIRQLSELHQAGALTDSEFRMKKWDVLSKS